MKKYILGFCSIVLIIILGFIYYNEICLSSAECACKYSAPGDPTCMNVESLTQWCLDQRNPVIIPQCMGLKGVYPVEEIVQKIIDYEGLQPFLHPEMEGRVPLKVSDHKINSNLNLTKYETKVVIVPHEEAKEAFLEFTKFECKNNNYCNISFDYNVEGVSGSTGVWISNNGTIKLEKTSIYER